TAIRSLCPVVLQLGDGSATGVRATSRTDHERGSRDAVGVAGSAVDTRWPAVGAKTAAAPNVGVPHAFRTPHHAEGCEMPNVTSAAQIVILSGLLMAACGRGTTPATAGSAGTSGTAASPPASAPTTVTTASVSVSTQPVTIQATGTFTAAETSQVSPL